MSKDTLKTGEVLRKLLADTKTSLKELSSATGVPISSLSQMKHNRPVRKLSHLKTIAQHFGVSVFFLLWGEDDPAHQNVLKKLETEVFKGVYEISLKKLSFPKPPTGSDEN
jgi:transcriptional regulator with XRE-family HTH domain